MRSANGFEELAVEIVIAAKDDVEYIYRKLRGADEAIQMRKLKRHMLNKKRQWPSEAQIKECIQAAYWLMEDGGMADQITVTLTGHTVSGDIVRKCSYILKNHHRIRTQVSKIRNEEERGGL